MGFAFLFRQPLVHDRLDLDASTQRAPPNALSPDLVLPRQTASTDVAFGASFPRSHILAKAVVNQHSTGWRHSVLRGTNGAKRFEDLEVYVRVPLPRHRDDEIARIGFANRGC